VVGEGSSATETVRLPKQRPRRVKPLSQQIRKGNALAEELLNAVVDAKVVESCDLTGPPRCSFRVSR
jgi:hypothetical protein